MYDFMCEDFDVEEIRRRYRAMTDEELLRSGRAAARFTQDQGTPTAPRRKIWDVHLREARAEWRRRHPKE